MGDYTTNYTFKFPENWFATPTFIIIQLYGVQIINTELTSITFEGIVFDDISKYNFMGIYVDSDELGSEFLEVIDFKIISDTCIQFKLNRVISPEIYDFKLMVWN